MVAQHLFPRQRVATVRKRIRPQYQEYTETTSRQPSDLRPKLRLLSTLLEADGDRTSMCDMRDISLKS